MKRQGDLPMAATGRHPAGGRGCRAAFIARVLAGADPVKIAPSYRIPPAKARRVVRDWRRNWQQKERV